MKKKISIYLATIMILVVFASGYVFAAGNTTDSSLDLSLSPTTSKADYDHTSKRHKEKDVKVYVKITSVSSSAESVAWVQGSTKSAPTTFKNCADGKNYNLSKKGVQYMTNNVIGNNCYYARIAIKGRAGTGKNHIKGVWSPDNTKGI